MPENFVLKKFNIYLSIYILLTKYFKKGIYYLLILPVQELNNFELVPVLYKVFNLMKDKLIMLIAI